MASNGGDGQQKVRRPIVQSAQWSCPVVQDHLPKASDWSELLVYWTGPDQQSTSWSRTIARLASAYDGIA